MAILALGIFKAIPHKTLLFFEEYKKKWLVKNFFIIGELHDGYARHEFQRDLIEALVAKHPKVVVGFEFFQRQDEEALELWRTGAFGLSGRVNDAGEFEVTTVQKGSLAEKNGLAKGDVIMSIDGVKINSVAVLRLLLSEKRWDDAVVFEIRKSVKVKK
jgi:S1-C subfamily serine protease